MSIIKSYILFSSDKTGHVVHQEVVFVLCVNDSQLSRTAVVTGLGGLAIALCGHVYPVTYTIGSAVGLWA